MKASADFLLSALGLEQWLRFAWLNEQERLDVPAEVLEKTKAEFPELAPLQERLLEGPVGGEGASAAILAVASARFGDESLAETLDDPAFQAEVRRFLGWVQDEADAPTCVTEHFGVWWRAFLAAGKNGSGA